jgi:hypothetical protein
MCPDLATYRDEKKFMWDGCVYDAREPAESAVERYEAAGFEALLVEDGDKFLAYSRKVVKETVPAP